MIPDDVLKAAYDAALSYRQGQATDPIHHDAALQDVIANAIMAERERCKASMYASFEALRPFAKKYDTITPNPKSIFHEGDQGRHPDDMRDDELALVTVTIGDIRQARLVLSSSPAKQEG